MFLGFFVLDPWFEFTLARDCKHPHIPCTRIQSPIAKAQTFIIAVNTSLDHLWRVTSP